MPSGSGSMKPARNCPSVIRHTATLRGRDSDSARNANREAGQVQVVDRISTHRERAVSDVNREPKCHRSRQRRPM